MWLPETEKVLNILSGEERVKDYVFIGGSALAFYLHHRLSEDIDLATPDEFLKMDKHIDKIMDNLFEKGFNIREGVESSAFSASKRDFYVNDVKVTFFASGDDFLKNEKTLLKNNLYIANLDTLIGMKTAVIHHRIAIRDYYDIYTIAKEFSLEKAINEASRLYNKEIGGKEYFKFDETNFLKYIIDLEGVEKEEVDPELNPKYDIAKKDMEEYFKKEVKNYATRKLSNVISSEAGSNITGVSENAKTSDLDSFNKPYESGFVKPEDNTVKRKR